MLATIMIRKITILTFILISNLTSYGQIKVDTLYFNQIEIRVFTFKLHQDTVVKAYIDQNTPRVTKKIKTNVGRIKRDLTLDSIVDFVSTKYQDPSITLTDLSIDKPSKFIDGETPNLNLAIAKDSYYIDAINYYWDEIEKDSNNYLFYYELAKSYDAYNHKFSLLHDNVIGLLQKCIGLNPNFEKAYILQAKTHERIGIMKGHMMSEPHAQIVDLDEIKQSINCLNKLLNINPDNIEANQYLAELKEQYVKNYTF